MQSATGTAGTYLTKAQVAAELGVSVRTVTDMIGRGDLKAFKLNPKRGGHVRILREDLNRTVEAFRARTSGGAK